MFYFLFLIGTSRDYLQVYVIFYLKHFVVFPYPCIFFAFFVTKWAYFQGVMYIFYFTLFT